ncbi:MAG: MIP/aquaporin family protein [Thermoplasmatota archaeon]
MTEARPLVPALLAEAAGTFALVFVGCGAIMVDALTGSLGHVGVSLAFGLVVGAMIYAVGHVSMAHFNPAVTLAFAATGHFPWRRVVPYWLAQTGAAVLAAVLLRWALGPVAGLGATRPSTWVTTPGVLLVEALLTACLMFVIIAVATDPRAAPGMAGAAIGATVTLAALMGGPLTGASLNPARSLGPAVASLDAAAIDDLWFYLVGPAVGALLGGLLYQAIRRGERPRPTAAATPSAEVPA